MPFNVLPHATGVLENLHPEDLFPCDGPHAKVTHLPGQVSEQTSSTSSSQGRTTDGISRFYPAQMTHTEAIAAVIQHKPQPPLASAPRSTSTELLPPNRPEGEHTWHPHLPQSAGESSSPSSPRPLPKLALSPHILHSKMQKNHPRLEGLSRSPNSPFAVFPFHLSCSDQPAVRGLF